MKAVWPDTFLEEGALTRGYQGLAHALVTQLAHVSSLRVIFLHPTQARACRA